MSWILPNLNSRVQLLQPNQKPNDDGGLDLVFGEPLGTAFEENTFENLAPLKTIWMGFQPISYKGSGAKYIRGKQVSEEASHEFICRFLAVADLGKEFNVGFSEAFKYMEDLTPVKTDYFLFVEKGSTRKGRMFRILETMNVKENDEYFSIVAKELEERGTGL